MTRDEDLEHLQRLNLHLYPYDINKGDKFTFIEGLTHGAGRIKIKTAEALMILIQDSECNPR